MPSGWETYYLFFLSALFSLAFPLVLQLLSGVLARNWERGGRIARVEQSVRQGNRRGTQQTEVSQLSPIEDDPRKGIVDESAALSSVNRMNTRFFFAASAALLLLGLGLVLIPVSVTIRGGDPQSIGDSGSNGAALLALVSIVGMISLGLVYSSRKGDLSWLKSYSKGRRE
jgi:hypothetical protein